jgi:hypothetical protein
VREIVCRVPTERRQQAVWMAKNESDPSAFGETRGAFDPG